MGIVVVALAVTATGVVVVTADRSNADVRTVTLYKVAGGEHSGRSVKTAWEFEVSVPEGATRAVAVAGGDDDACVMWSNGVWRAYTSHNDESRMRTTGRIFVGRLLYF